MNDIIYFIKNDRKEMFYLTTHSTHFIDGYLEEDIIMVNDDGDSQRGNQLPPRHDLTSRITHTPAFVIPVVEQWLEREIS